MALGKRLHNVCFPRTATNQYVAHKSWPLEMYVRGSLLSQEQLPEMDFGLTVPRASGNNCVSKGQKRDETEQLVSDLFDTLPLGKSI